MCEFYFALFFLRLLFMFFYTCQSSVKSIDFFPIQLVYWTAFFSLSEKCLFSTHKCAFYVDTQHRAMLEIAGSLWLFVCFFYVLDFVFRTQRKIVWEWKEMAHVKCLHILVVEIIQFRHIMPYVVHVTAFQICIDTFPFPCRNNVIFHFAKS